MNSSISVRQQVLEAINQLPQDKLGLVLNFVSTLKSSENNRINQEIIDPLADFIGTVNIGKLAENIDQDLYE